MMSLSRLRQDVGFGAGRRYMNESLAEFAGTVTEGEFALEIGCGHYDHRDHFAHKLYRFDLDPSYQPDVSGDALNMPIKDNSIDVGISISVLEHVHDPYQMVREWYRVTKPGGRGYAWVPFFFGVHGYPGDVSRFTEEGVRLLFERAGFQVVRIDSSKYSGLFLNLGNAVHFVLPRTHRRAWVGRLNRFLNTVFMLLLRFDRKLKLRTLYVGTEIEVVKP
jgi:SAM-dependent methyltransferase